jgi:hypothetical protein
MKADAKPTLEAVAGKLAKGPPPDSVIARLRERRPLIGYHNKADDDDVDRLCFESASHLQKWATDVCSRSKDGWRGISALH